MSFKCACPTGTSNLLEKGRKQRNAWKCKIHGDNKNAIPALPIMIPGLSSACKASKNMDPMHCCTAVHLYCSTQTHYPVSVNTEMAHLESTRCKSKAHTADEHMSSELKHKQSTHVCSASPAASMNDGLRPGGLPHFPQGAD